MLMEKVRCFFNVEIKRVARGLEPFKLGALVLGLTLSLASLANASSRSCPFMDPGKSLRNLVTSNVGHYWCAISDIISTEYPELNQLNQAGFVIGDPHFGNVMDYSFGRESGLTLADIDDVGEAPLFLDFLRYLVFLEAFESDDLIKIQADLNDKRSSGKGPKINFELKKTIESYVAGLSQGKSNSAPAVMRENFKQNQNLSETFLDWMDNLFDTSNRSDVVMEHFCWSGTAELCVEGSKPKAEGGKFKKEMIERESLLAEDKLQENTKVAQHYLTDLRKSLSRTGGIEVRYVTDPAAILGTVGLFRASINTLLQGYLYNDISWAIKDSAVGIRDSGSSAGLLRVWLAMEADIPSLGHVHSVVEFKELTESAILQINRHQMEGIESRVRAVLEAYTDVKSDSPEIGNSSSEQSYLGDFAVVKVGERYFWRRPRHFQNYNIGDFIESSAEDLPALSRYLAYWLGYHHGKQAEGANLHAALELLRSGNQESDKEKSDKQEAFKDKLKKVIKAYLRELEGRAGN